MQGCNDYVISFSGTGLSADSTTNVIVPVPLVYNPVGTGYCWQAPQDVTIYAAAATYVPIASTAGATLVAPVLLGCFVDLYMLEGPTAGNLAAYDGAAKIASFTPGAMVPCCIFVPKGKWLGVLGVHYEVQCAVGAFADECKLGISGLTLVLAKA